MLDTSTFPSHEGTCVYGEYQVIQVPLHFFDSNTLKTGDLEHIRKVMDKLRIKRKYPVQYYLTNKKKQMLQVICVESTLFITP